MALCVGSVSYSALEHRLPEHAEGTVLGDHHRGVTIRRGLDKQQWIGASTKERNAHVLEVYG